MTNRRRFKNRKCWNYYTKKNKTIFFILLTEIISLPLEKELDELEDNFEHIKNCLCGKQTTFGHCGLCHDYEYFSNIPQHKRRKNKNKQKYINGPEESLNINQ